MAQVIPFTGWRYDFEKVSAKDVLAPPYDVINEPERKAFVERHPNNIVRLDLGVDPLGTAPTLSRYELAAADLAAWRNEGVLIEESSPAFYIYEQEFIPPVPRCSNLQPATEKRLGFVGLVRIADYEERIVLPHEGTLSAPKVDRRMLMETTECGFSQVFGLYDDPEMALEKIAVTLRTQAPLFEVTDVDGVIHRMWAVTDESACAALSASLADKPIVIADGHHRYDTALNYRNDMRASRNKGPDAPYEFISMYLCNSAADDLTILPSHRLIKELPLEAESQLWRLVMDVFETERLPIDTSNDEARAEGIHNLLCRMAETKLPDHTFGLYAGGNYALLLHLRDMSRAMDLGVRELPEVVQDLDVALLHKLLIEGLMGLTGEMAATGVNVLFSRDGHDAANRVARGEAALVLYVNTTRVEQVMKIAIAGQRMPQKGTYFYPKVLAGIVLQDLRTQA